MAGWTVIDNTWLKENGPGCWTKLSLGNEYCKAYYERQKASIPSGGTLDLFVEDEAAVNPSEWNSMHNFIVASCNYGSEKFVRTRYYDDGSDTWIRYTNFNAQSSIPLWDWVSKKKCIWNPIRSTAANQNEVIPLQHAWAATNDYWEHDVVQYKPASVMKYYECKVESVIGDASNDPPSTDTTQWQEVSEKKSGFRRCPRQKFIVPTHEWSSADDYSVGDRVWYSVPPVKYYRCVSAITGDTNDPPNIDTTRWKEVKPVPDDGWPEDWTDYDDPAYSYGPIQDGDIRGPWNLWDIQHHFNEMIWVRLRSQDESYPGDDGCAACEYTPPEPVPAPPAWDDDTHYDVHDTVTYNGTVYECRRNDWPMSHPPQHLAPPDDLFDITAPGVDNNHWVEWSPPRKGAQSFNHFSWDGEDAATDGAATMWGNDPWLCIGPVGAKAFAYTKGNYFHDGVPHYSATANRRRCKVETTTNTWDDRHRGVDYYGYVTIEDWNKEEFDANGDTVATNADEEEKYGMFGTETREDSTGTTWTSTPACGDENRNSLPNWCADPFEFPDTTWKGWVAANWAVVLRWDVTDGFDYYES